jgi:hypothetical protein
MTVQKMRWPGVSSTGSKHDLLVEYDEDAGSVRFVIIGNNEKRHAGTEITVNAAVEVGDFLHTGRAE